jgi:hypothetical protein
MSQRTDSAAARALPQDADDFALASRDPFPPSVPSAVNMSIAEFVHLRVHTPILIPNSRWSAQLGLAVIDRGAPCKPPISALLGLLSYAG